MFSIDMDLVPFGFLQLFAEGEGVPAGGQSAGAQPAGVQQQPGAGQPPVSAGPAAGGGPVEPELPPNMQEAFNKRLGAERAKLERDLRASIEAETGKKFGTAAKLEQFFRQQGYDPDQVLAEWERQNVQQQAQHAGLSPETLQRIQALESKVTTYEQRDRLTAINAAAESLKTEHGELFDKYAQQAIDRAAKTGESLEDSFGALAWRELRQVSRTAVEQEVLAQVTGRSGKTPVNGAGGPQVTPQTDVSKMPKAEFEKLKREVLRGERRSL